MKNLNEMIELVKDHSKLFAMTDDELDEIGTAIRKAMYDLKKLGDTSSERYHCYDQANWWIRHVEYDRRWTRKYGE